MRSRCSPPLLDRIDLAGAVVTADALHVYRGHAKYKRNRRRRTTTPFPPAWRPLQRDR